MWNEVTGSGSMKIDNQGWWPIIWTAEMVLTFYITA